MCSSNCLLAVIAIIFPPLPVWVKRGLCTVDSVINIALCVLGFIPGLIHSWYIITSTPDDWQTAQYERVPDAERGHVNVYYVQNESQPRYGTIGGEQSAQNPNSTAQAASQGDVPPTYTDAVKGDHKVQGP